MIFAFEYYLAALFNFLKYGVQILGEFGLGDSYPHRAFDHSGS